MLLLISPVAMFSPCVDISRRSFTVLKLVCCCCGAVVRRCFCDILQSTRQPTAATSKRLFAAFHPTRAPSFFTFTICFVLKSFRTHSKYRLHHTAYNYNNNDHFTFRSGGSRPEAHNLLEFGVLLIR